MNAQAAIAARLKRKRLRQTRRGSVAVDRSELRRCSDGFERACDNGGKVRVAFALDRHDREAPVHVASTEGVKLGKRFA